MSGRLRRVAGMLAACLGIGLYAGWQACPAAQGAEAQETYGAEANPTGDPIGGGVGYSRIVTSGDYTVRTKEELVAALNQAQAGEVVYVAAERIDLSGLEPKTEAGLRGAHLEIPEGVTLAGDRGRDGAPGPVIHRTRMSNGTRLLHLQANVRLTGLRIQGPDPDIPDVDYEAKGHSYSQGIWAAGPEVEVDNCEIMNFERAGVNVNWEGDRVRLHHNHFHDVLDYPILVGAGRTLIEANRIEWVSHPIAGSGGPDIEYEARYNLVVLVKSPETWGGEDHHPHGFDMHGWTKYLRKKVYPGHIAGNRINIHHNTLVNIGTPSYDVRIRGVPRELAEVHHNWFPSPDPERAVSQSWVLRLGRGEKRAPIGNLWVYRNLYGPDKKLIRIGDPTTPQVLFHRPGPPSEDLEVVTGELSLHIEVNPFEGLELKRVTIDVDGDDVYTGEVAPEPGAVVVDTRKLANGEHDLWVTAVDSRDGVARYFVRVLVQN